MAVGKVNIINGGNFKFGEDILGYNLPLELLGRRYGGVAYSKFYIQGKSKKIIRINSVDKVVYVYDFQGNLLSQFSYVDTFNIFDGEFFINSSSFNVYDLSGNLISSISRPSTSHSCMAYDDGLFISNLNNTGYTVHDQNRNLISTLALKSLDNQSQSISNDTGVKKTKDGVVFTAGSRGSTSSIPPLTVMLYPKGEYNKYKMVYLSYDLISLI